MKVLNYPGAKWNIANWIIDHMPKHHSYLEPFFGSGAVLFNKQPSSIETINDLDCDVTNLFECIRDDCERLARLVAMTPYSREEYDKSFQVDSPETDPYKKALVFLTRCWQGHGFRTNGYKVGWKNDVQGREQMYAVYNWYRLPNWVIAIADRLKKTQIENMSAIDLIKRFNYKNVLIYADPPYLLNTRSGKQYKHEMTEEQHIELLETLLQHRGPVIISGYQNDLYDDFLVKWGKNKQSSCAEYGKPRTEVIWMNYDCGYEQLKMWS